MNRNQCIFDEKCLIKSNFHWVVFQPMKIQAPILKYISGNLCVVFRTCKTLVHKRKVIFYLYVISRPHSLVTIHVSARVRLTDDFTGFYECYIL